MKQQFIIFCLVLLAGCTSTQIETMSKPTAQKFDLADHDKDGVIEARERCNDSFKGSKINNYGCGGTKPIFERIELKVLFANNSAQLAPKFYSEIQSLADFLRKYPNTKVTIEGHSSKLGSYQYNLDLSQRRAEAVSTVLINHFGIKSSRVAAKGYSFSKPVDASHTKAAHKLNRRVIAEVVGQDSVTKMKWNIYTDKGNMAQRFGS